MTHKKKSQQKQKVNNNHYASDNGYETDYDSDSKKEIFSYEFNDDESESSESEENTDCSYDDNRDAEENNDQAAKLRQEKAEVAFYQLLPAMLGALVGLSASYFCLAFLSDEKDKDSKFYKTISAGAIPTLVGTSLSFFRIKKGNQQNHEQNLTAKMSGP